jgi:hypothetical protein
MVTPAEAPVTIIDPTTKPAARIKAFFNMHSPPNKATDNTESSPSERHVRKII